MNELNNYLTIDFLGKVLKGITSLFTLIYSILILKDVLDLQTFYDSAFNIVFKLMGILIVIASLFLLLTSFN
jgi:hypothetical protein